MVNEPVEIARITLRRMAEQGLAPTPENYVREYRRTAGLPPDGPGASQPWTFDRDAVAMVRGIVQVVAELTAGLAVDIEQFDVESKRALAQIDHIRDADELAQLLRTVTASAISMKQVIDTSHRELSETRRRLDEARAELDRAQELARTDSLTGLGNRRALSELVGREVARSRRTGEPLSVCLIDIDHFKQINDQYGHEVGDKALAHVAMVTKSALRATDEICRYGGEEFVVTLPGATDKGAHFVLDRIRTLVENTPLPLPNRKVTLRFSAGVAQLAAGESSESLVQRADAAMYQAKKAGRNCVHIAAALATA